MKIEKLEDLEAWQEARKLCDMVYKLTLNFPKSEEYNIKKHTRESARGIAANIAEGFGRHFLKENLRFYGIAQGCLNEVKSDFYLSFDAGYINDDELNAVIKQTEITRAKLNGLVNNVRTLMKKIEFSEEVDFE